MTDQLEALTTSVRRLHDIAAPLNPAQLDQQAYPSEWSVAQTLSHIGSGAVIMRARIDDILDGAESDDGFAPSVWEEWNAKTPEAMRTDALVADAAMVERLASLTAEERAGFRFQMGPMDLDFDGLVGLRLNEHAVHTWDVEVTFDPAAPVAATSVEIVVDNLQMLAGFTGKPIGVERDIHVHTTAPERDFTLAFTTDGVSLQDGWAPGSADLELPAEAFIRLIYGRLDPDHTPSSVSGAGGEALLDDLRGAFPGF
jgi:uncharacterized protein (TIGR03083 family)